MRIVSVLLFIVLSFSTQAQNNLPKIVKEYTRGDGPTYLNYGQGYLISETHYDREERTIKCIRFGKNEQVSSEVVTEYYQGTQPKTITSIEYPAEFWSDPKNPRAKPDTTVELFAYKDTLLLRKERLHNGTITQREEYAYNDNGFEIEMAEFLGADAYRGRWLKTTRDQENRPSKVEELYPDGSVKNATTYTYNAAGNVAVEEYASEYMKYLSRTVYTYNSEGKVTRKVQEVVSPSDRKSTRTLLFEYNSKGLLTAESALDATGKIEWKKEHHYNASGQKTKTQFDAFAYFYTYNAQGDLISMRFEDSRSEMQSEKRFVYERNVLQKTEHHNREDLTYYVQHFYSENGLLVREEPTAVAENLSMDWIDSFAYNDQNQLTRKIHRQPALNGHYGTIYGNPFGSQSPPPTPVPGEKYVDLSTYYTYDKEGRQVGTYYDGASIPELVRIENGKYSVRMPEPPSYGMPRMPSDGNKMIVRVDTVSVESRGSDKIVTLKLDYLGPVNPTNFGTPTNYHKNLIREETYNAKGELIAQKETTADGMLRSIANANESKSLQTYIKYTRGKSEQIQFSSFGYDKISTTYYNPDGTERLTVNAANDSTEFRYENGRLAQEIKRQSNGFNSIKTYDYDKQGIKTMERTFSENGTENYRIVFENNGRNIVSELNYHVRPNYETVYQITYGKP